MALFMALVAVAITGCATQRQIVDDKPLAETRLFVTRSADQVTLSWQSGARMMYTVLYNNTRSARSQWQVLPGAESIRGNGRMMTLSDRVPVGETRYYRLQTVPLVNRR
jgi:hypothetical protein